jgi:hypothetical protein
VKRWYPEHAVEHSDDLGARAGESR